jgi:hypothetical protein
MAKAKNSYDPLADPWLWRVFLSRLTGTNPDYDCDIIESFAETCEVDPRRVWAKLKPTIKPPTATRH